MGNTLGGKKSTKIMKINGETFKLKTPVLARSLMENHPGHVLLESETVKYYGIQAKPLEPQQELKPKRLYFLIELPKFPNDKKDSRRVQSGIHMSAKDRLESLMLSRRFSPDMSIFKTPSIAMEERNVISENYENGGVRVRMRLPKAEVEKLMAESKDGVEVVEKIVSFCMTGGGGGGSGGAAVKNVDWNGDGVVTKRGPRSREKRVTFSSVDEGKVQLNVTS